MISTLKDALSSFSPISLNEMDRVAFLHRVDTKFVLNANKLQELLKDLKDDYFILDIDERRYFHYSTIYYDTPEFRMYIDHIRGKLNRFKVRHRHYVDSDLSYVEVKFKNNTGKTSKWREKGTATNQKTELLNNHLLKKHLPNHFKNLKAVLKNNFHRITLVDRNFTQRVTIDFDISYLLPNAGQQKQRLSDIVIIEIKSDRNKEKNGIQQSLARLRIKQSGFSKYCMGIALTDSIKEKTGALKPKFIRINKLTNNIKSLTRNIQ